MDYYESHVRYLYSYLIVINTFNTFLIWCYSLDIIIVCISLMQLFVLGVMSYILENAKENVEVESWDNGVNTGFEEGWNKGYKRGCPPVKRKKPNPIV